MEHVSLILSTVQFMAPSAGAIFAIVLAGLLLLVSGFASGSEIAFFSLSPSDLNELDPEKSKSDANIEKLRADSERTLATILITNNLVNVTIIMLCNYFFASVVTFGAPWLEFVCITVVLTFLLLLFGEIMPKIFCGEHALAVCRAFSGPILLLRRLFYPLSSILMSTSVLTQRVVQKESHVLSVDDLEQALELTDKTELKEEQNMLEGIVRFGDETVKEVMTSRQDIVDLDFHSTFQEVIQSIVENNYSRIPVYQESIDNVRGILYIKDLLPHLNKPANFRWQTLVRPATFVPETKMIDDLLRDFQAAKVHIAIVVDEFGGTSGLVTMEDIIEEIVGEINDEYDEDERTFTRLNQNTFVFEAKTLLTDFRRIMQLPDDTFDDVAPDADTLAGLLLELKGEFPQLHERLNYDRFTFEVMEMDERRIVKIKVIEKSQKTAPAESENS